MNFINFAGIAGIAFLVGFLGWFFLHPISRDKVLVKFGWKYFILLFFIMLFSVCVIAWFISKFNDTCPCQESIMMSNSVNENPWLTAIKYSVKMQEAKDGNLGIGTFLIIMLFQIVVFEGLVLAAIVGWTSRRTKRFQKGQVRYRCILAFNGLVALLYDRWFEFWSNCVCWIWNVGVQLVNHVCKTEYQLYVVDWKRVFQKLKRYHYAVVIGGNEVAPSVIKNLLMREEDKRNSLNYVHEQENQYVILQTSGEIGEIRQTLRAYLTEEEYSRVIIYSDIRYSYEGLKALHLEDASEIYVLGENTTIDGGETYHDTMNMRCVNLIAEVLGIVKKQKDEKVQNLENKIKNLKNEIEKLANCTKKEKRKKKILKLEKRIKRNIFNEKVCKVLFEYQTTYSVFQFSDVTADVKRVMYFIPFNRYESWARRVMVDNRALALVDENSPYSKEVNRNQINYEPLDGYDGIGPDKEEHVHFIIVGMSKMGVAMGVQALYQAHYPNVMKHPDQRSRITFIDVNAEQEMLFFKGRYATLFELARHRYIDAEEITSDNAAELLSEEKWIDPMKASDKWGHLSKVTEDDKAEDDKGGKNFLDVEIEFIKGELESEGVREYLRKVTADEKSKITIAICLPLTHQAVAAALYMPIEVYQSNNKVQDIWVYQREAADIILNLVKAKEQDVRYEKLKPFGMLYGEYLVDRTLYLKSLLVNAAYDKIYDSYVWPTDMGDKENYKDLRTKWNELSVSSQMSNKLFVDTIYQKIRSVLLPIDKPENAYGYNGKIYDDIMIFNKMKDNIKKNLTALAVCEKNRWNMEKLLFGFLPCTKQDDMEMQSYVENAVVKEICVDEHKKLKKEIKKRTTRTHPNICSYDHLNIIDPGAKDYDIQLCMHLPEILMLVDGYHSNYASALRSIPELNRTIIDRCIQLNNNSAILSV